MTSSSDPRRSRPGRAPHGRRAAACALAVLALALATFAATPRAETPRVPTGNPHGAFQGDCSECHGAEAWKPARVSSRFDHRKRSGFALTGAHLGAGCTACHTSLDFTLARRACVSCHLDPHVGELGLDCARCHSTRSFVDRPAFVRLHQMTRLPLVGAHAALDCASCHPPTAPGRARWRGATAECRACHAPGSVPDHAPFGDDCARCHTTMAWVPSRFDHAGTGFPLTCPHRPPVTCAQCHGAPWVAAPPRECVACHRADYDATTAPGHAAAGFPTTCGGCHDVAVCGWTGASFDHDRFFPVSGKHAGIACATCHTTPSDYARFSCLSGGCHPSSATDGRHGGVNGYAYLSSACYRCHPAGRAGD